MANYGFKGWIKLWREEMHNPLYDNHKPFDEWHAWMDLCMQADDDQTLKTSLEALKNRWSWGSTWKVTKLLQTLSQMKLLTIYQTRNKGTLIHIEQGFVGFTKSKNQTRNQTRNQTKNQTEELLLKEVSTEPLTKGEARTSEYIEDNNSNEELSYKELMEKIREEEGSDW